MENIGSKLKKRRQEKGISLENIAKETRIQTRVLKALENGEEIDVGGPGYERIMLISYAKSLGCSKAEIDSWFSIDKEYQRTCKKDSDEELFPSRVLFNKNILFAALLVIIVIILTITVYNIYRSQPVGFPFRSGVIDTLGVDETIKEEAEEEITPEPLLPEEEEAIPLPVEDLPESNEEQSTTAADTTADNIAFNGNILTDSIDRTNYLESLLKIDTANIFPMYNKNSYLKMFVID